MLGSGLLGAHGRRRLVSTLRSWRRVCQAIELKGWDHVRVWERRGWSTKGVAVVVAGVAFVTLSGTAGAAPATTTAAAKQYEAIVAPFNKLANAQKAPAVSELRTTMTSTESRLRSAHWPSKATKDVKLLATDLHSVEGLFVAEAKSKSGNYKPTKQQASNAVKFLGQITKVHKDLGLPATNNTGL